MDYTFKRSKNTHSMYHAARIIGDKRYGRTKLFELLRSKEILDKYNQPLQKYQDLGYFIPTNKIIGFSYRHGTRHDITHESCRVTDEGIEFIRALIKEL